ncbi:hypothetical protein [Sphingobium sp. BS19]|uniref:hypothetical protein n=1 Tax=Sphingobium sp. BS19 TaxID=3018973 RepID=UPI0022EFC44F|nr:hypothetical protein [Sphingobium sp. BS19]GLI97997.1 hypothetical protein Sbs19_18150 [Sphingobium sp. BS19]
MKTKLAAIDKVTETPGATERGYAAWKQAKVARGLEQAKNRDAMIPMEQVLRDFGLEG